jgi:putative serine protease PepD
MMSFIMGIIGVVVGAVIVWGVFAVSGIGAGAYNGGGSSGSAITINPNDDDSTTAEAVAAKASPSVVCIEVYTQQASSSDLYSYLFGQGGSGSGNGNSGSSGSLQESSLGSGVILTSDGYILTNYHVISGAAKLMVDLSDGSQQQATVSGTDQSSDLAVIKINATGLTPIETANSDDVKVGEWVMAIGSPYGLQNTVTTGIVSATARSQTVQSTSGTSVYADMIQTDAAINPGNSGGALVNDQGQLIGINALISSNSDSSSGVGFAIASNYALNIADQLKAGQTVTHAYLGVQMQSLSSSQASQLGANAPDGAAYITSVVSGSPAASAGLQRGDVVVSADGSNVNSAGDLMLAVRKHSVGDQMQLTIYRNGQQQTITATLGSDAQNTTS